MKLAFFRGPTGGGDIWQGAHRPSVMYPRQTIASNAPLFVDEAADSVTQWHPEGIYAPRPVQSRPATGNFYGTDPTLWGPPWVTNWDFMAGAHVAIPRRLYGPLTPQMGSPSLHPSTIYNPLPAFGQVAPRIS